MEVYRIFQLKKPSVFYFLMTVVFTLFLSGCGTNFGDESNKSGGKQLVLSTDKVYLSEIDSQYSMTALITDIDGVAYLNQPSFEWASSEKNIATVDGEGLITAIDFGETSITVNGDGETSVITVVVSDQVSTLFGVVRYEDRAYDTGGFTEKTDYFKVVKFAKITLIDESDQVVQTTYTDANGNFSLSAVLSNQQAIIVSAQTDIMSGFDLNVQDRQSDIYAVSKNISINVLENFELDIPLSSDASGAFNILDVFTNAAQFTLAVSSAKAVALSAFWEPDNSDGTYYCEGRDSIYCPQGKGVYVYNQLNADTDEYDDDVLYHEFAHYFTDVLSKDDSPGGCHVLSSQDLDLRLAWSEGWGDFFPIAVKSWLAADAERAKSLSTEASLPVTAYIDTYGDGAQIAIDLDNLSSTRYRTAANELAIAKILWDASQQYGMEAVAEILSSYFPGVSTPINIEAFWDGWLVVHKPNAAELANLEAIFSARGIYYQADEYEQDGILSTLLRAAIENNETHTIYSTAGQDVDIIPFQVQQGLSYTVQTQSLTSGADTSLVIRNEQGLPLSINGVAVENDDYNADNYFRFDSVCGVSRVHNDSNALASKVEFTAVATGTYYAEIGTTPDPEPYLSAGRYGTYDLKITTNN